MKILIATMTCGEGHNAIARSIRDALGPAHETKIVDVYAGNGKDQYNGPYLFVVRYFPHCYNLVWNICRRFRAVRRYRGLAMLGVNEKTARIMQKEVEAFRPDVILCTHNQASNLFCWMKIHNRIHVPVYSVFFDYVNCPWWEGSVLCDGIFTPNPIVHPSLIGRGFREEQLIPAGFPVNPKFERETAKSDARARLGIPEDAFVALTVSGGAGIGNTTGLVKSLMKADTAGRELVVLAVCGRNAKAERQLRRLAAKRGWNNVRVFGFVDNVPELMRASDLYFCRGGGGAVSEAMASGVNFVVRERVTAQELCNKRIFTERGLCYGMKRLADARRILEHNIAHPEEEEAMRERVKAFAVRRGAENIAAYLEHLTD